MDELKAFWRALDDEARKAFALGCNSTPGHIRNVLNGSKPCGPTLAAAVERHSQGRFRADLLLPSEQWQRKRDPSWPWHPKGRPLWDFLAEPVAG